jgi:uncharacterized protein (DUF1501 family)
MSKKSNNKLSRRKFLGTASCAAIGYGTLLSSLINLKAVNAAAIANSSTAAAGDYKALVCFLMSGGNDSFNMLIPRDNSEYMHYERTRSNLAIERGTLLNIDPSNTPGRGFGLHPSMPRLRNLFNQGDLSFISNIGTLIEPSTKQQIYNEEVGLPLGLFSHADQIQQWQTGLSNQRSAIGWGGKVADLIKDMNGSNEISMNLSISGTNIFQKGNDTIEFALDPYYGSEGIYGYRPDSEWDYFNRLRTYAIDSMIEHQYQDIFKQTYVDVIRTSRDAHILFQNALEVAPDLSTYFDDNYLAQQFHMAARTISIHEELDVTRQIFFIDMGGWDHHDEVLDSQEAMLQLVDDAMAGFMEAIDFLNLKSQVVTFSISEFARTLTSNGNGTDHAWGGNVMSMGGPVIGKNIFGTYPSLELDNPLEIGNGVLIPTTSTDQYFAELALWFGVNKSDLLDIFPNLGNFYDLSSSNLPIGFLNI